MSKNTNIKPDSYKVTDAYLLYQISDAGLLHIYLKGVGRDKRGNKAFYFERSVEIKEIIDKFRESEGL